MLPVPCLGPAAGKVRLLFLRLQRSGGPGPPLRAQLTCTSSVRLSPLLSTQLTTSLSPEAPPLNLKAR